MRILKKHKSILKKSDIKSNDVISIANNICNNNVKIASIFDYFKVENIDQMWSIEKKPINTFRAYLYGLSSVGYLCNAYEISNEIKYLDKAKHIIISFIDFFNMNREIENEFSISTGTINIIHFLHLAEDNGILNEEEIAKIIDILNNNVMFLTDIKNYRNSNHGIWQDMALLSCGLIENSKWDNENIINIAMDRICKQITFNFTEEYINIENSPFYHIYNLKLFESIKLFIDDNLNLSENHKSKYNRIEELSKEGRLVFNHMIRQDQSLPHLGDTEHYKERKYKFINESIVYPKTGLALLKGDQYYVTLKSGVRGIGHKHRDDLSFTLFYKGVDVFIDAGKLNYEKKDINYAIRSVKGHNLLYVNDSSYSLKVEDDKIHIKQEEIEKAGIERYTLDDEVEYVSVFNNFYTSTVLKRDFILIKPNLYIIFDNAESIKKRKYTQNFNLGPEFEITSLSENLAELNYYDKSMNVIIKQHKELETVKLNYGNSKNNKGFSSKTFNKILKNYNIEYICSECKNANYITSIQINTNDESEKKLLYIDHEEHDLIVYYEDNSSIYKLDMNMKTGKYIKQQCREEDINIKKVVNFEHGKIIKDKNSIRVEVDPDFEEYACYLTVDKEVLKSAYQKSNIFIYNQISNNKDIKVKVYMKSNGNIESETIELFKGIFEDDN